MRDTLDEHVEDDTHIPVGYSYNPFVSDISPFEWLLKLLNVGVP